MDKQIETPLYQIYYKYHGVVKKVQVKDESKNISGSIKDRPARRELLLQQLLKIMVIRLLFVCLNL